MNRCTHCEKKIGGEPFRWHGDESVFCSMACLPEGVLDEPHAMEYAGFLESYREHQDDSMQFETLTERVEVENELSFFLGQCGEYVFGDSEGSFYKVALAELYDLFLELHRNVNEYFLDKDHYEYSEGLYLEWDVIEEILPKEMVDNIKMQLHSFIEVNRISVDFVWGISLDDPYIEYHLMRFEDDADMEWTYTEVMEIMKKSLLEAKKNDGEFNKGISREEFRRCPVCSNFNTEEEFYMDEEYKVERCCDYDVVF